MDEDLINIYEAVLIKFRQTFPEYTVKLLLINLFLIEFFIFFAYFCTKYLLIFLSMKYFLHYKLFLERISTNLLNRFLGKRYVFGWIRLIRLDQSFIR